MNSITRIDGERVVSPWLPSVLGLLAVLLFWAHPTSASAPTVLNVPSPQYPTIQSAVNAAKFGDTVVIQSGLTYFEAIVLKYKSGAGYITIQSSALSGLPPAGVRVGPANSRFMAKIVPPNPSDIAISTEITANGPSHGYKLIGLEVAKTDTSQITYDLIRLGSGDGNQNTLAKVANQFVVDRCYIHGNANGELRRGIALNSASTTIESSYISDVHQVGTDTQAIGGWNGPGPYIITNNYLEAAGENILFGGADPAISNLIPSDIDSRHNYLSKQLAWHERVPAWNVKNLFELKNAKRVTVSENIFQNNWADGQDGYAILFTVRNQNGTAPWSTVEDVVFSYNIVRNTPYGIKMHARDDLSSSQDEKNISIIHNQIVTSSSVQPGGGKCLLIANGNFAGVLQNLTLNHNTCVGLGAYPSFIEGDTRISINGLAVANNIAMGITAGTDAWIKGRGDFGTKALNLVAGSTWAMPKNIFMLPSGSSNYPNNGTNINYYVNNWNAVGFVDFVRGNYALASTSPYKNRGSDGNDPGADAARLKLLKPRIESGNWLSGLVPE